MLMPIPVLSTELAKRRFTEAQEARKGLGWLWRFEWSRWTIMPPSLESEVTKSLKKVQEWNTDIVIAPRQIVIITIPAVMGCSFRMRLTWLQFWCSSRNAALKGPLTYFYISRMVSAKSFRPDIAIDIISVFAQNHAFLMHMNLRCE